MKKLIIYDLDGTLVDTREDIVRAVNFMLETLGVEPRSPDYVQRCVGRGMLELIRGAMQTEDPVRVQEGLHVYEAHYGMHMLDNTRLYPRALEMLEIMRGRRQVVITNKPNPFSIDILKGLGVAELFDDVIAGSERHPKKPDPESTLACISRFDVDPKEAVFIGDSRIDIETGRRAGVETVALTHGFGHPEDLREAAPDHLLADFSELLAFADRHSW